MVTFSETHQLAAPQALLTRRLDVDWRTLWDALKVEARRRADDPQRLAASSRSASMSTSGGRVGSGRAAR